MYESAICMTICRFMLRNLHFFICRCCCCGCLLVERPESGIWLWDLCSHIECILLGTHWLPFINSWAKHKIALMQQSCQGSRSQPTNRTTKQLNNQNRKTQSSACVLYKKHIYSHTCEDLWIVYIDMCVCVSVGVSVRVCVLLESFSSCASAPVTTA